MVAKFFFFLIDLMDVGVFFHKYIYSSKILFVLDQLISVLELTFKLVHYVGLWLFKNVVSIIDD